MGKRFKTFIVLAVALLFMGSVIGPVMADQSKVVLVGGGQAYKPLDDFVLESESPTIAGDSWYVDSGKSASGDGKSWDYAVITLNEAIDLCTASSGDVIHVAPGHAETIDAATDVIPDVIGITVVGYGEGNQRPTFTWATAAAANIPVSAVDFKLYNMIFDGSSTANDGPTAMFTITAAGFQLIGCEVITGDSTEAASLVITGNADADRMKVIGCEFTGSTDTGTTAAITFTKIADDIEVAYCTFTGDYSSAAIYSASAITQVNIHHNYIFNYQDDDHAIEISSNTSTGVIADNHLVTNAYATALDSGGCDVFETYWANDTADDVMGVQVWTHEDGAVTWSATELVVLETQANDALVDENLDHLVVDAVTTSLDTAVNDASVMGYLMADSDISTYSRTTDSLEALGTQVADSQQQSNVTASIEADFLDELIIDSVATSLATSVSNTSILGYLAATSDVSTYSRATDSLEAIGTNLETGVGATYAIEADYLDELIIASVASSLATSVSNTSILGYLMSTADVSTYSRATDSLEALGTNIAAGTGVTVAIEADYLDELIIASVASSLATSVSNTSILGYLMSTSDVSTYDRTTDSFEAIGTDVVAIEIDTQEIQSMQEQCTIRATDTLPISTTETIFTIANGPIRVLEFIGEVTTVIEGQTCNLSVVVNPTVVAASDMASILDISGHADGSLYSLTGAYGSVLVNNVSGVCAGMSVPYILPIGIVAITTSATNTGNIGWFIRWQPLYPGATVTAAAI